MGTRRLQFIKYAVCFFMVFVSETFAMDLKIKFDSKKDCKSWFSKNFLEVTDYTFNKDANNLYVLIAYPTSGVEVSDVYIYEWRVNHYRLTFYRSMINATLIAAENEEELVFSNRDGSKKFTIPLSDI